MEANAPSGKLKQTVYLLPLFVLVAGFLACFSCAALSSAYWDLLALLLIISLASLLVGAVLGFLFGIPRLNKKYDPREEYDRNTKYRPNTNLEEISDWLTKIIIGVTLTQLTKIPVYLQDMADRLLTDRACMSMNCDLAKPSLIALLIYFTIAGFITGYIYTRLHLPNLLSLMEENRIKAAELLLWQKGMKNDIPSGGEYGATPKVATLTEEETEILRKIKAHDNRLTGRYQMSIPEKAAVNVLLAKGIITAFRENPPEGKTVFSIVDKDILERFA
ncbi:MAG: hypothetical protein PHH64_03630 [Proteiniphilum sp.]|nr:hypothetical protein [Proteiniphilum sp.]MDD4800808.1 hypothetical protein [Proteiniphilum sp.]